MSMTLILWKAPVVREPDEADALLERFYRNGDDSAFEPCDAIKPVWDELLRLYPDDGSVDQPEDDRSPWADFPPHVSDRLLSLDIRWGADDAVIDDIVRLAREHELVLFDPQGPDVYLPTDPIESEESSGRLGFGAYAAAVGVTLLGVLLAVAGWVLSIPVIDWLLIIAGLFVLGVGVTLSYAFFIVPGEMRREGEAKAAAGGDS